QAPLSRNDRAYLPEFQQDHPGGHIRLRRAALPAARPAAAQRKSARRPHPVRRDGHTSRPERGAASGPGSTAMRRFSAVLIGLLVAVFLVYSSIFIVNPREQALVLRFGEITRVIRQPG